jgi:hypothetical protein
MLDAADWYLSYGFLPAYVEPDFDCQFPMIRFREPDGNCYYELSTVSVIATYPREDVEGEGLADCREVPRAGRSDHAGQPVQVGQARTRTPIFEVARICDATNWSLVLPSLIEPGRNEDCSARFSTRTAYDKGLPVVIAERPGQLATTRMGQFDQVIVDVARPRPHGAYAARRGAQGG